MKGKDCGSYWNEEDEGNGEGKECAVPLQLNGIILAGKYSKTHSYEASYRIPPCWGLGILWLWISTTVLVLVPKLRKTRCTRNGHNGMSFLEKQPDE